MGKIKTSIMVDEGLWAQFKGEVSRRFKGHRKSIPPVSDVVEDLIRNWVNGLHRNKIPIYEVAFIASIEPKLILKYARINPTLAFDIFRSRPQAFIPVIGSEFKPREPGRGDYFYEVGHDKIIMYFKDYDGYDIIADEYYFIGDNIGEPYFNGFILDDLLGEGYSALPLARLKGVKELCISQTITFSLYDSSSWGELVAILREAMENEIAPVKTFIREKECNGFRLERTFIKGKEEIMNGVKFLELLGEWLPRSHYNI